MKHSIFVVASTVASIVASVSLVACAGPNSSGPERDPWAGYQGTYAGSARASVAPSLASESAASSEVVEPADADEPRAKPGSRSKAKVGVRAPASSKATIKEESISSIGVEALGNATAGLLGASVVSKDLVIGSRYELVEVQLKGATVQILRAATTPDADGPELDAPKARHNALSPTEEAWYDADGDVLVVVNSANKATSQKVLTTIVKR